MANHDLVAIGASAGGVEALALLCRGLPAQFPATILITQHLPSHYTSSLDEILSEAGELPATFARDGDTLRKGQIFLAPPGCHLIAERDRLLLGRGPSENNVRPAIDPMLRSVAVCCGPRAIGVILSGTLGDGASGLNAIQQCGGLTVVQDPDDAAFSEMPRTALNRSIPDHIVNLADLPLLLNSLVQHPAGEPMPVPASIRFEVGIAKGQKASMQEMDRLGRRSVLTCPECNGVLWEIEDDHAHHYRCHVGHAYSADMMDLALDDNVRRALGSALRALEERIALTERLRKQASDRGHNRSADIWTRKIEEIQKETETLRKTITRIEGVIDRAA
jgi:two-component system, chemotaxis family, protein-glutamate methylesterase/glutaminase